MKRSIKSDGSSQGQPSRFGFFENGNTTEIEGFQSTSEDQNVQVQHNIDLNRQTFEQLPAVVEPAKLISGIEDQGDISISDFVEKDVPYNQPQQVFPQCHPPEPLESGTSASTEVFDYRNKEFLQVIQNNKSLITKSSYPFIPQRDDEKGKGITDEVSTDPNYQPPQEFIHPRVFSMEPPVNPTFLAEGGDTSMSQVDCDTQVRISPITEEIKAEDIVEATDSEDDGSQSPVSPPQIPVKKNPSQPPPVPKVVVSTQSNNEVTSVTRIPRNPKTSRSDPPVSSADDKVNADGNDDDDDVLYQKRSIWPALIAIFLICGLGVISFCFYHKNIDANLARLDWQNKYQDLLRNNTACAPEARSSKPRACPKLSPQVCPAPNIVPVCPEYRPCPIPVIAPKNELNQFFTDKGFGQNQAKMAVDVFKKQEKPMLEFLLYTVKPPLELKFEVRKGCYASLVSGLEPYNIRVNKALSKYADTKTRKTYKKTANIATWKALRGLSVMDVMRKRSVANKIRPASLSEALCFLSRNIWVALEWSRNLNGNLPNFLIYDLKSGKVYKIFYAYGAINLEEGAMDKKDSEDALLVLKK